MTNEQTIVNLLIELDKMLKIETHEDANPCLLYTSPVRCLTERTGAGNGFFLPYGSVVMCNVRFWNGITEITSGWLRRPM